MVAGGRVGGAEWWVDRVMQVEVAVSWNVVNKKILYSKDTD